MSAGIIGLLSLWIIIIVLLVAIVIAGVMLLITQNDALVIRRDEGMIDNFYLPKGF